jgi:hypothetical protein
MEKIEVSQILNARKRQELDEPSNDTPVITKSGGEVDPETGNAFFYQTKEELTTVNTPLMSRKSDGREEQIGFTSTTTKKIVEEKHWLMKSDPDQMEEKTLESTYETGKGAWPTDWNGAVQDPMQDPQEFLLNFPTLADHGVSVGSPAEPAPDQDLDLTQAANSAPRPVSLFELPEKTSLSTRVDNLVVEPDLAREFEQYIGIRL